MKNIWKPLYVIDIQAFTKAVKITHNDILVRRHGIIACSCMRHSTLASAHYCCDIIVLGVQNYIIWANKPRNPVDRYLTNAFYRHKNLTRIWQRLTRVDKNLTRGWQESERVDKNLTAVDKSWQEFDNELTDIWQASCKSLIICYLPNHYFLLKP